MVAVKEQTKVMTGTVVKIDLDDAGAIRVTTGNMTQIDIDDDEEDEENYETFPPYQPTAIEYDGKRYILREPLQCTVKWDDEGGDFLWVEYEPFDLYNTGRTIEEAIQRFNEWFAINYERNNELVESGVRLGERLEEIRCLMNQSVLTAINVND
jgi:hypothetical protein